jgi:hypothetical protein
MCPECGQPIRFWAFPLSQRDDDYKRVWQRMGLPSTPQLLAAAADRALTLNELRLDPALIYQLDCP